jgi:hypothetical protein
VINIDGVRTHFFDCASQECTEYARKYGAVDDMDFVKLIQKQRVLASEKRRIKKLSKGKTEVVSPPPTPTWDPLAAPTPTTRSAFYILIRKFVFNFLSHQPSFLLRFFCFVVTAFSPIFYVSNFPLAGSAWLSVDTMGSDYLFGSNDNSPRQNNRSASPTSFVSAPCIT